MNTTPGTSTQTNFVFPDPRVVQQQHLAVLAVNALSGTYLKPAKAMLDRAGAPSDEDFEQDPEGATQMWGYFVEKAHRNFRTRGVRGVLQP